MQSTYYSLFFVTLAGLLSPWLAARMFRGWLPAVVIEILLGFVLGPHGLKLAAVTDSIDFLAAFGFSYLMFLSGIELDFSLMFQRQSERSLPPWVRGGLFFIVTLLLSFGVSFLLYEAGFIKDLFMVTLILSTTSVGIVTPSLKEKGWSAAPFGQAVMLYALIADVCTLILFTAYITFHSTGNAFSLMLVMAMLLIFVLVYRILRAVLRLRSLGAIENATSEIGLRGSFALILAFLALSKSLGTEVVVGAFLAGAVISLLSERHSLLTRKLNSIGYGFLLPIFFVNVGMTFNMNALQGSTGLWIVLGVCLLGMYVNKLIPAHLFMRNFPGKLRWGGGFLLSSRLSLLIAASQIASEAGILSEMMRNGFILLAVVTCFLSPLLFSRSLKGFAAPEAVHQEQATLTIDKKWLPEDWIIDQIEIHSRKVHEKPMRSLGLPQDVLFISIFRDDETIIPRGRTVLQQFDTVQVMGDPSAIAEVRDMFED